MAKRKRHNKRPPGPNPDPERYILVVTKEGSHFRRKRGTVKPALLNSSLQQMADGTTVCSPVAKHMAVMLKQHLRGLETGRLIGRFTALLKKAFHEKGTPDFSSFRDYDFQPDHPLDDLLLVHYTCRAKDGVVEVHIPIEKEGVKKHNQLVSNYYFDLILLHGDAITDDGLKVKCETSPLYSYSTIEESTCTLSVRLPETEEPWMAMLKVSSLEGDELAHHPRHYGMKVVAHSN